MTQFFTVLAQNRFLAASVILFGIGFVNLMLQQNLIRKIIGMNIMDSAVFLALTSFGSIRGQMPPIVTDTTAKVVEELYINPVPSGLVLTGIVVSVSFSAFMLALAQRLYVRYHTLNIDEILMLVRKGGD